MIVYKLNNVGKVEELEIKKSKLQIFMEEERAREKHKTEMLKMAYITKRYINIIQECVYMSLWTDINILLNNGRFIIDDMISKELIYVDILNMRNCNISHKISNKISLQSLHQCIIEG
jgi:hypothetical protein